MSQVRVEFFGMARQLADCESTSVEANTLAEVIAGLSSQFPEVARRCFEDGDLREHWIFNIDGRFVRDPESPVSPTQPVLLMSADAGG